MRTGQDHGGWLAAYVAWVHRLYLPIVPCSIALAFANYRLGSYAMLCVALALLTAGAMLTLNLGGSASRAIIRHRVMRPWGQSSVIAWRAWGAGMVMVAVFLATAAARGGYLT
jgi:hypothetical protein